MQIKIISNVAGGILKRNRNLIIEAVKSFEGQAIEIVFRKPTKKRSNPQNAFYYGVVIPIVNNALREAGTVLTLDDTHEILKLKFLKETISVNEETGEMLERIKSTTELTTGQFCDFIKQIQIFAAEYFGVIVPDPNENLTLDLT